MDIVEVFRRSARRHGDRAFLFDQAGAATYAEADARSEAVAEDLASRGLGAGDTLALCASDRVSLWLAIIGAWKAGILPALVDARTRPEELAYFVDDIGAKLVATTPELCDRLAEAGAREIVDLDALGGGRVASGTVHQHAPDSGLFLSYTSGTTGKPKGAVLLSGPVTLGTSCIAERLGLRRGDVLLATTPTASSFQLVAAIMPAMHAGAAVGLVAGSAIDDIWDVAHRARATVLVAYPLTLSDMVNAPQAATGDSPFRVALSGGSPLAPRIKRDYADRLGIALLESYGQSELGGFMAMGSPGDDTALSLAGFVGRPLPDRLAYIGGPDNAELPTGDVGEVLVSHGFFPGYRNKPDKTAEATAGGVLHTGDLGMSNEDGYLKVLGRTREADGAGRRGGFLRELEDAYYEHSDVRHAAVVETPDGEIEAFVELQAGRSVTVAALQTSATSRVVEGLHPRRTTILEKMPRSFSGKADRLRLATEYAK